ncbi:MAG: histidine kinase, partial [Lachnospiraceae bacterium]|nr:histidine kinase [Lachnospiraceae bacterium]
PPVIYTRLVGGSGTCGKETVPYISDISESLSRIFFYNVKGGQVVSLQDELDNLQNYIRIQRIRFPEKFEVSYEIEPELEKCRILKFLLQPLVENAIDHGIGEKRRKGRIVIRANRTDEEKAEIVIEDNGVGIAKEKLKMLQNMLNEEMETIQEKDKGGIGIRNVQMRIRNYYGSSYGILLESKEGYGTKIRIILPVLKGEE